MSKSWKVTAAVTKFAAIGHGELTSAMVEVTIDPPEAGGNAVLKIGAPENSEGGKAFAKLTGKVAAAYFDKQPRRFKVEERGEAGDYPYILEIKRVR